MVGVPIVYSREFRYLLVGETIVTCRIRRLFVSFCQEEKDCYLGDVEGLIKRVHISMLVTKISF